MLAIPTVPGRPFGKLLGTVDQAFPFHDSTSFDPNPAPPDGSLVPTAKQNAGLVHETPLSWLPEGEIGLGVADQDVPFHDSITASVFPSEPTATHH